MLRLRLLACSAVRTGVRDGTRGVKTGAWGAQIDARSGAQAPLPAQARIPAQVRLPAQPSKVGRRLRDYSIANALETIATGLLSVAESSVTRPKLMVRPRRTTRASASTSEAETARMKCVVWSTVVIGR